MQRFRPRRAPDPALVVAIIALIVAVGGSSYAAFSLPGGSVGSKQLKKNAVIASKLHKAAVTEKKLKDDAVTSTKLGESSVLTEALAKDAVTEKALADAAVGAEKLQPQAVDSSKLAKAAVTEEALANEAVGAEKLQPQAVDSSKLAPGAVTEQALAPNAVTGASIEPQSLTADAFAPGTLTETDVLPYSYTTGMATYDTWVFWGAANEITVTAGQRIAGQAQVLLATEPGSDPQTVFYAMCYQAPGDTNPKPMGRFEATTANLWGTVYAGGSAERMMPFVALGAVAPPAGTYEVGFCVRNPSASLGHPNVPLTYSHAGEVVGWTQASN